MRKQLTCFFTTILVVLLSNIGLVYQANAQAFIHPGGLHTMTDLNRMKAKVAAGEHPWIDAWNVLITDWEAQNTYTAGPYTNIGGSGNRQRASQDAHAAYLNIIRWYVTGDTTYAECAVRICNAWSAKVNEVASGELFQLPINNFMQVAELLRIYPGWKPTDIAQFKTMALTYFYPACHDFLAACSRPASWDAPAISSIMGIGVFCDDTAKYNEAVTYFKTGAGNGSLLNAIPLESGQITEMGRDMVHANIGPACLAEMCQTAWNQGLDLYSYGNNRLLAGFEYYCKYNLNHPVTWVPVNDCDQDNFLGISYYNARGYLTNNPVFEMLYNHYGILKGLNTPYIKALVNLARPETQNADFFGYGTFTYTLDATASLYRPYPIPATPTALVATAAVSKVYLEWSGPSGDVANGYNILRSTTPGGPYTSIASWTNNTLTTYTDWTVTNGTKYYYVVSANNQSGTSGNSGEAMAQPVATKPSLPIGWVTKDVGSTTTVGSAGYASVVNNTYVVNGSGSGMGGTSDSFTYTYGIATGDVTITAHMAVTNFAWTGGDKAGFVIRESLDPNAKSLTLYQGEVGNRFTRFETRSATGGSTTWQGGNKFSFSPWYRLQRSGNTFTAFQSTDGISWQAIGTSTVAMSSTCYVGFSVCAGATGAFSNITYENVAVVGGGTAPAAPASLTGTAQTSSRIKLSWPVSTTASGYNVKRSLTSGGQYTTIATNVADTSYIDSGLVASTRYYYAVKAVNIVGEGADSVQTSVQTKALSLPPAPTGFTAIAGNARVSLNWNATDEAPGSYNVKRSTISGGPYTTIKSAVASSYIDSTAVNGSTYFYTVSAVNAIGEGAASTPDSVFLGLKLTGTLIGTSGSWNNNPATTIAAAVDSNLTTFFDANQADGAWVGYDFGFGSSAVVSRVSFAPRSDVPQRMVGGIFQGANTADFSDAVTLFTVSAQPAVGVLTDQVISNTGSYRYLRYLSPAGGSCNIAELQFWGKLKTGIFTPPEAPTKLAVSPGDMQVLLSWATTANAVSYNVKRSAVSGGPYSTLKSVTTTSYADSTAVNGTTYYYVVSGVNTIGEGANSSEISAVPTTGEYSYWPFNETSGSTATDIWNSRIGTLSSGATFAAGHFNNGLNLSGTANGYATLPAGVVSTLNDFTVATWVKLNTADNWARIFDFGSSSNIYMFLTPKNGGTGYLRYGITAGGGGGEQQINSSSAIAPGVWTHVVVTLSGSVGILYVNGVEVGRNNAMTLKPSALGATTQNYLGKSQYADPNLNGMLDDFRIYSRALTAADVLKLYGISAQTLTFTALSSKAIGDFDATPGAAASSNLPVSYTSSDTTVATIVSGKIHIKGAGTSTITATQAGNGQYMAATPVSQTLKVVPLNLQVQYQDGDNGQLSNNIIRPYLKIANADSIGVAYSELTMRYWFTAENYAGINTWIDYAELGNNNVKMKYVSLTQPYNGAFGYIEYSFTAAGKLGAGSNTGQIQSRFANQNWGTLNEANDYSHQSNTSSYTTNNHITLYRNGKLIWGTEPTAIPTQTSLSVSTQNQNQNTGSNTISTYLAINNTGNMPVAQGDITARYWFTAEGTQNLNYWVDYAAVGNTNVSGSFVKVSPVLNGADTYFAIALNSSAGTLYPLSTTGNIQYRIAKTDWSNFNELNDYSYLSKDTLKANNHVTVYYKGQLIYGIEPTTSGTLALNKAPLAITAPVQTANKADETIIVHQGLSPNGDGINDFLLIEGLNAYPNNTLTIMNRNGVKVFETKGYDNGSKVFDGHSNITGTMQQAGTYFYSLDYQDGKESKHKTGFIIIKY
ncbi:MAG: Beta-mannanase/endoglucanase precursor [Mucilaginibacter sp.]|nr:Beta-mannanase/endoglucanase precursor [Mucilaginibacter sp.]